MYRKDRKGMTFKYCDTPPQVKKKLYLYQHVSILVMGLSTECQTTITNCLITFRMNSMPRTNYTISMPLTTAISIPSIPLKIKNMYNACMLSLLSGFLPDQMRQYVGYQASDY